MLPMFPEDVGALSSDLMGGLVMILAATFVIGAILALAVLAANHMWGDHGHDQHGHSVP